MTKRKWFAIIREFEGGTEEEIRREYRILKLKGMNPFVLKCKQCGSWLFVFSRNFHDPAVFEFVYQQYLDMLLNDYGSNITCPNCGTSNRHLIEVFKAKMHMVI